MPTVSLVKCSDYEQERVTAAIKEAVDRLGGIEQYVKPGDRVLLKFNLLVVAAPEKAITTHPAVVRAMIRQVQAAGGVPLVGDCGGSEGPPHPGRYRGACRQRRYRPPSVRRTMGDLCQSCVHVLAARRR